MQHLKEELEKKYNEQTVLNERIERTMDFCNTDEAMNPLIKDLTKVNHEIDKLEKLKNNAIWLDASKTVTNGDVLIAIENNDLKKLKELIQHINHIDTVIMRKIEDYGDTNNIRHENTLIVACKDNRSYKVVKALLDAGANPNTCSIGFSPNSLQSDHSIVCESPLLYACKNNNKEVIKLLIENNAEANYNFRGETPLMFVWQNFKKEIEDNEYYKNLNFGTPDQITVDTEIIKLLIEKKVSVEYRTNIDYRTTHSSSVLDDICKKLYKVKEHMVVAFMSRTTNHTDETPKKEIQKNKHIEILTEILKLMVEKCVDININSIFKDVYEKDDKDLVKFMLEHGADEQSIYKEGKTFLEHAKYTNKKWLIDFVSKLRNVHSPLRLVELLTSFREDSPIKYTTHDWDDEKFKYNFKKEYVNFKGYLSEVENQWNIIEKELYELYPMLHTKIYNFLLEDKSDYKNWCSRDGDEINIGWSSLDGLEQWINDGNDPFNFETKVYKIDGKTVNSFGDIIRIFKREIQVRTGELKCIKEKDMLKNIFKSINKNPKEKFDFTLNFDDMKVNQFYTDVAVFKSVIKILFKQFSEESNYKNIKIESCGDCDERYYVLKVIQVGSFGDKTAEKMLDMVEGGDFSKIKENLLNLCDWSVESSYGEENYRINFLKSDNRDNIERDVSPIGYTHIFRFYK